VGIEKRKADLEREIARKARHLEALRAMPDFGELADGTVLALAVTLGRSKPYTYIGLKAADAWYLTGKNSPNGVSSDDLAEWLMSSGRLLVTAEVMGEVNTFSTARTVVVDLGPMLDELLASVPAGHAASYPEDDGLDKYAYEMHHGVYRCYED
jgi:hypothetical protein